MRCDLQRGSVPQAAAGLLFGVVVTVRRCDEDMAYGPPFDLSFTDGSNPVKGTPNR